jgi:hypothetical protein
MDHDMLTLTQFPSATLHIPGSFSVYDICLQQLESPATFFRVGFEERRHGRPTIFPSVLLFRKTKLINTKSVLMEVDNNTFGPCLRYREVTKPVLRESD